MTGARWVDVDTRGDLRMASRWLLAGGKERDGAVAKVNRVLSGRVITPLLLSVAPGLRPDTVTVLAAVVGLSAAAAILAGWVLVAALAVQLASILDGADGEIARVAHRGSRFERFSTRCSTGSWTGWCSPRRVCTWRRRSVVGWPPACSACSQQSGTCSSATRRAVPRSIWGTAMRGH